MAVGMSTRTARKTVSMMANEVRVSQGLQESRKFEGKDMGVYRTSCGDRKPTDLEHRSL